MIRFLRAALAAAATLCCTPAAAQRLQALPVLSTPITGAEMIPAASGSGCASQTSPCATVAITPAKVAAYLVTTFQARDADLDAIAALQTAAFGRQLLTRADAASVRAAIGVTATGGDTSYLARFSNLNDLPDPGAARTNLGLGTLSTQAASAVAVSGGSVDGTAIGATTPAPGSFTQINGTALRVQTIRASQLPTYAGDSQAGAGGLVTGDIYMTSTGELRVKL